MEMTQTAAETAADRVGPGVSVERRFTKPGVHPFEAIEWEIRDAVIGDPASPAFEQRSVEFPASWSQNATNIVAQKYFRGNLGTPERESSVKQIIGRVAGRIAEAGREGGYFSGDEDAEAFEAELTHILVHQMAAFNSPVWFNVGWKPAGEEQSSACFILAVDDDMRSILQWNTEEGLIFRGGSGSGINLSKIRGSTEQLSKGGTASGPVSFMRGADAWAGSIKSGGGTRRAAKMVVLDADHPDIRDFIWCKAKEEEKADALRRAGFDMSIDGDGFHSIQYQNANNSVRLTDGFIQAVEDDADWQLLARTTGEVTETVKARELMHEIAEAAWRCADPGVQYDTTINDWHTTANDGRITASNPCFPGDARVHTPRGLMPIAELYERMSGGERVRVYTNDATTGGEGVRLSTPVAVMQNGVKEIVRLRFSDGRDLRCTPDHKLWTVGRGYVRAEELTKDDRVVLNEAVTAASEASWALPIKVEAEAVSRKRGGATVVRRLPEEWSEGLGELMGHLMGDGCMTPDTTVWVYGGDDIDDGLIDSHEGLLVELIGGVTKLRQGNGTMQLKAGSYAVRDFFRGLGVTSARAAGKRVPKAILSAPVEVQASFLRGLFGADGCVSRVEGAGKANRYVGLASRSEPGLKDVQRMLSAWGVRGRIYRIARAEGSHFSYTRKDGSTVEYQTQEGFDLRISGTDLERFAHHIGFSTPRKQGGLESMLAEAGRYRTKPGVGLLAIEPDGQEMVYDLTEPLNHSYIVDGVLVSNCSEFLSNDNTACNLASLNLMKFRADDGSFLIEEFEAAVDTLILAQEIVVSFSAYPTEKITENARRLRQLGIGYANLGALLMSNGMPYDSNEGRAVAGAVTALMTGRAYRRSAEIAAAMGPYEGYADNREPHNRVMAKHRSAAYAHLPSDEPVAAAAQAAWDDVVALGRRHGFRNAQASVLAPTGCLVSDSLVSTSRGLVRLGTLGDEDGPQWQPIDFEVATDEGPRRATQFYVNGEEQVVSVETKRGYRIQGTPTHRIKVVDTEGDWVWRRMAELEPGDRVPLTLGGLVGEPNAVALPPLGDLHWNADFRTRVPRSMTSDLAELVGYFMGDGSLHAKGLRLCVADGDDDVIERLAQLSRELFGLEPHLLPCKGYTQVAIHSVPLTIWWDACGFAKLPPFVGHSGKGFTPRIPDAVLHSNDRDVYAAFVRGLFEADGTTNHGYASFSTTSDSFSRDTQTLLLSLGFVTTRKTDGTSSNWGDHDRYVLRLLNVSAATRFADEIGFISARKIETLLKGEHRQAARGDHIPVGRGLIDELAPGNDALRKTMLMSLARRGDISRRSASAVMDREPSPDLEHLLGYFYDEIDTTKLLEDRPTFDLSVPDNVTYVANGFVSHNTISFLMDCDTTGVEPDFSLVKFKNLVGGGTMTIENQGVPRALENLGYASHEVDAILAYLMEPTDKGGFTGPRGSLLGAPFLREEHLSVFDVAVGERAISASGHIEMMGATQPFISGAISKTINMPNSSTVEDIEGAYLRAHELGVKALAIYRDGSKTVQALVTDGAREDEESEEEEAAKAAVEPAPRRRRMPRERQSITHKFSIGGHEGYITAGMYDDGTVGEIFLTDIGKEGSTLRGMMNSFATAISIALQYGVPLETLVRKFCYMRFEPEGMTQNPEIPFAKSMPDYIMRWLASRFLSVDVQEDLGILTPEVRSRKTAQDALMRGDTASPVAHDGSANGGSNGGAGNGGPVPGPLHAAQSRPATTVAAAEAFTDSPPVIPAQLQGLDLGPACGECGGMMQRTGSCYTCSSCGNNTGCG